MKKFPVIAISLICLLAFKCSAQKDALYTFPDSMTHKKYKKEFVEQFNKGIVLYKMNCSRCHSTMVNKKEVIPDFSLPQLLDYEIRFSYPEHQDPMREVNISKEELDMIVLFLQYKKRNTLAETKKAENAN